ncbi:MAG: uracil phosphoribosyltransferase [bacterium]|nr:uracil phosphoribosyltransferase [bacterium]
MSSNILEKLNMEKVKLVENPVVLQNLSVMRDKNTDSQGVRMAIRNITRILMYEVSKMLPLVEKEVETPITKFNAKIIDPSKKIIISPILRAGLIFTDSAIDILPQACIRHIGMYRDEKTLKPVWYYNKIPMVAENPENTYVIITDPMLATGNSMKETIKLYSQKNIPMNNIKAVCILSAPEGLYHIQKDFPDIEIFTTAIDKGLNEHGYIIPGMGDAGDRIFNT